MLNKSPAWGSSSEVQGFRSLEVAEQSLVTESGVDSWGLGPRVGKEGSGLKGHV